MDLIDRSAAVESLGEEPLVWVEEYYELAERDQWRRDKAAIESVPSAQPESELVTWLLDWIWNEGQWELNWQAFPELLCRKLVTLGYLREKDGEYER